MRQRFGIRQQHGRRIVTMFGLAKQIGGAQFSIYRLISNDHCFGWSGKQINADASKQLTFGFGNKGVARANQHMDSFDGFTANGHGTNCLNAAKDIDFMCAAKMHRCHNSGVRASLIGRGRCHDTRDTGNRGSQHRHMRRGHHWKFASRYIAANRLHRDVFMAKNDARHRLNLNILHRGALDFREFANLRLRKANILHIACRHLGNQGIDLLLRKAITFRCVIVEFLGKVTDSCIAPCFDAGKGVLDNRTNLGVIFRAFDLRFATFQIANSHSMPPDYVPSGRGA